MINDPKKIACDILSKAGLKKTGGRIALLKLLLNAKNPLTQQEISDQLRDINFNYVSIYRSLNAFLEAGIIHKVETGDRSRRFAICSCGNSRHCHPHFICRCCGRVECLVELKIPGFMGLKPGYIAEEQEIYIRGLCARCSNKL
ncbi:MAG: Fur family transcriptional regulator [Dethiobacteria bacterium]|jgi:Fur family ferric uptake transcriptional regulator